MLVAVTLIVIKPFQLEGNPLPYQQTRANRLCRAPRVAPCKGEQNYTQRSEDVGGMRRTPLQGG